MSHHTNLSKMTKHWGSFFTHCIVQHDSILTLIDKALSHFSSAIVITNDMSSTNNSCNGLSLLQHITNTPSLSLLECIDMGSPIHTDDDKTVISLHDSINNDPTIVCMSLVSCFLKRRAMVQNNIPLGEHMTLESIGLLVIPLCNC